MAHDRGIIPGMADAMSRLEPPIRAMFDATNAEDAAAFVDAFAEDAVLVDWGRTFTGHAGIATWNANENIGVHSRIAVTGVDRDGDRTTVRVSVSGDGYNGGGAFVFETAGGLITRMEITG
jgi:ketosteroid isomerase-like protein